ncbi:MAG: imidazole glycerol phosphate synthase subunit HisH [Gammaproteobacteria bacterium]|nr:imidazole glycerol phosphate synthase subunit HisH [Gammaproteobacteria bacterium]
MERVAVVDYGMGNLRSVAKALEHVAGDDREIVVSDDARVIAAADRVVFPGQGAIRDCMMEIDRLGLGPALREALGAKPFLGICIGLQALMDASEEHQTTRGLGFLAGGVRRFPADVRDEATGERLKVPHMGWNRVLQAKPHPLWSGIDSGERFYFVHSYYVVPEDASVVAGRTRYGVEFTCAVAFARGFAVQFHPEKSQRAGLALLANFLAWNGER